VTAVQEVEPPMLLDEAATRIGQACRAHARVFELLGRASTMAGPAPLLVSLHLSSRAHGAAAEAFADRLPVSASLPLERYDVEPAAAIAAALDALDGALASGVADAVAEVYLRTVLPALSSAHGAHRARTRPWCDAPVVAVLEAVERQLAADRAHFAQLLGTGASS